MQPSTGVPQDASTAVACAKPEQPVLLQQMLAMARQQESLQQQSQQVQKLLQQMREEQSTLASRLEDISKSSVDHAVPQGTTQAPAGPCTAPQGAEWGVQAHPGVPSVPGEDPAPRYTRLALRDLQALQRLDHNGRHIPDDVFRGTPEQHCISKTNAQGITRAEAAVLHRSCGGTSLLPSLAMPAAVALDIEEKDPLTVNSIMVQFLSLTPASGLNSPRKMRRCFMRFQFYNFRPTETSVYQLEAVQVASAGTVRPDPDQTASLHRCWGACTVL